MNWKKIKTSNFFYFKYFIQGLVLLIIRISVILRLFFEKLRLSTKAAKKEFLIHFSSVIFH